MCRKMVLSLASVVLFLPTSLFAQVPLLTPGNVTTNDLKGKVVLIRSFYGGAKLHFDEKGSLLKGGQPEAWTLAGVQIDDIKLFEDHAEIRGTRVALVYDNASKEFRTLRRVVLVNQNERKPEKVEISVDLDNPSDAALTQAVQRVFLSSADNLVDMVPEYWRDVIRKFTSSSSTASSTQEGKPEPIYPAKAPSQTESATPASEGHPVPADLPKTVVRAGSGVTAPSVMLAPEPAYNEPARAARFQGTTVLTFVISADGSPRDIHIARPLGFGLDDQAVKAVQEWRFFPARKDNKPVAVQINVEINFRLY